MICSPGKAWGGCLSTPDLSIDRRETWRLRSDNKYDGDTGSFSCPLLPESVEEIKKLHASKDFYVGVDGQMFFSVENDVNSLVFKNITG